jgi:hypothetical protein
MDQEMNEKRFDAIDATLKRMDATSNRIASTVASMQGAINDMGHYIRTELVTKGSFHDRMDAFSGRVEKFELYMAHQKDRLDDHLKSHEKGV